MAKKKFLHIFALLYVCLILFSGQSAWASQQNTHPEQIDQNKKEDSKGFIENIAQIPNILKIIFGTSVVAAGGSLVAIKNYFDERTCNLSKVYIELLDEKPENADNYTILECGKIIKEGENIEIGERDYHYYDVSIMVNRSPKKKIDYLVIKELIIEMNGYKVIYLPKGDKHFEHELCKVHMGEDRYSILMVPPTAKKIEHDDQLQAASIFEEDENKQRRQNQHDFKMCISYFAVVKWRFFHNFKHPEPQTILFKTKECNMNTLGIKPIVLESM